MQQVILCMINDIFRTLSQIPLIGSVCEMKYILSFEKSQSEVLDSISVTKEFTESSMRRVYEAQMFKSIMLENTRSG